jgi:hypothetical protein
MTPAFRSLDADGPLRLAVVGAGGMGRAWLETISGSSEAVLAGVAERSGRPLPGAPRDVAEAVSNLAWSLMCSRRVLGAAVITDEAIVNAMRMLDAG